MPSLNRLTDINKLYNKIHIEFKIAALKKPRVQITNFCENLLVLIKKILVLGTLW